MTKQLRPRDLKPVDPTEEITEAWLDGGPLDPQIERAAMIYLQEHCEEIKNNDIREIKKHARALYKMGMPETWTAGHLAFLCRSHWAVNCGFVIAKAVAAAYKTTKFFEAYESPEKENRLRAKSLAHFESLPRLT